MRTLTLVSPTALPGEFRQRTALNFQWRLTQEHAPYRVRMSRVHTCPNDTWPNNIYDIPLIEMLDDGHPPNQGEWWLPVIPSHTAGIFTPGWYMAPLIGDPNKHMLCPKFAPNMLQATREPNARPPNLIGSIAFRTLDQCIRLADVAPYVDPQSIPPLMQWVQQWAAGEFEQKHPADHVAWFNTQAAAGAGSHVHGGAPACP